MNAFNKTFPQVGILAVCGLLLFKADSRERPGSNASERWQANPRRLMTRLTSLAEIGKNEKGGARRLAFSQADIKARDYVMNLMKEAGLEVRIDEAGNIIGRREGESPGAPAIATGSHVDSVPEGGQFDGLVGVVAAVEFAKVLQENALRTHHPLEVIVFSDEEGGTFGSRALVGDLQEETLNIEVDGRMTLRQGIIAVGGAPDSIRLAARQPGEIKAFVELHIEQGGVLDSKNVDIGVVEGIVGINRWEVTVEGVANHAGTTPMDARQDALVAASHFVIAVNNAATRLPGRHVATVGRISAEPGAPNVIPGKVRLTLELRDLSAAKIQSLFEKIREEAEAIGQKTRTKISFVPLDDVSHPSLTDLGIQKCIMEVASELGLAALRLPSGAGHDTQNMARVAPAGMIFIPSAGGISHSPEEYSRPEDVIKGTNVLIRTLLKIDRGNCEEKGS